ncbi:MAG: PAS domain S-box protein, partial [Rhodoferax sp.]
IGAPIRDAAGRVLGVLVGTINLGQPSFLDQIEQHPYGKSGGFLLIAPQHKLFVAATDKSRIMQPVPAPGRNAMNDRFMQGFEGFGVATSSRGVLELSAGRSIPVAGWFLVATLPAQEAFLPIDRMLQHLRWATVLLTLLAGGLIWWMLRHQLAPLLATARAMVTLSNSQQIPAPLALRTQDEIGQLASGFNRLIESWTQREAALQKSQQNLSITLDSIGDAVIATDAAGHITRMNPTAERLCGWTLADALGQPLTGVFQIVNTATRQPAPDPAQRVMQHGEVTSLANHTTLLARDGHEYQIADSAAPIRNAGGAIEGVVLVFSDVTEKYQAQEALRLTRFSVEAASDSIFWMTPDARIVDVNAAACRALGYTREKLLQLSVPDVDARYNAELWQQHFAELRQRGSLTFESEQRTRDGRLYPVEVVANYVKHGNEERNCAFVRDITERKRAEQGLRLSEERYRFSLEVTGQIGWSCQPDGQVEDAPMWRQYSGQSLEEVVGWNWLDAIHPEDRESANKAVAIAVAQKSNYSTEYRLRRADGVYRNFMVRGILLLNADGSPKEWVGTCIDITERKQAEQALQQQTEALARSNAELEQFAYVASHDLRQPLRMVNSYLQLIARALAGQLDDDTREMMRFATDGAKRMDQMLVSLLEYSRIGRTGQPLLPLASRETLDEALHFLAPVIAEAQASVRVVGDWPQMVASRDEFTRLWQNLIGNAVKYRAPDRAPEIDITVAPQGAGWRFCVADNGIGIDPAQFDRLFKVFQRLQLRGQYEGNGIGLAVARKIV